MFLRIMLVCFICNLTLFCYGQISLNAWATGELSKGDSTSHFYYNEIHKARKDWRVGIYDVNVLTKIDVTKSIAINIRGQLRLKNGAALDQFLLPLANINFKPKGKKYSLTLGRFITPFGSFTNRQHPNKRDFITLPLAYSFYNNISGRVGFAEKMGEESLIVDRTTQWGSTMIYYGGYSNGLRFDWDLKPNKIKWTTAFTLGAPNINANDLDFTNLGIISKLKIQPKYFWEQQFSVSYGTFQKPSVTYDFEPTSFQQLLLGTDIVLGYGFWELRGEFIGAFYTIPYLNTNDLTYPEDEINLTTWSANLSLKYEFSFLSGLYAVYGVDILQFGNFKDINNSTKQWDNNVFRQNIGLGYKITNFLLFRTNYMIQSVDNHPAWAQNTWRTSLTIFY